MKKKNLFLFIVGAFVLTGLAASVYAWWLVDFVSVTSCYDSDGGLNFLNRGYVNITGNTTGTFYDYCINNVTVGEVACSQDVYNITGYAGVIGEYCTAINKTSCFQGRCI